MQNDEDPLADVGAPPANFWRGGVSLLWAHRVREYAADSC